MKRAWWWPVLLTVVIVAASSATLLMLKHPEAIGCPGSAINPLIDCQAVVTSQDGHLLGLPLGVWAFIWLAGFWLWMARRRGQGRQLWSVLGWLGVAYAIGTELRIGHICAWCTLNQAAMVLLALWSFRAKEGTAKGHPG